MPTWLPPFLAKLAQTAPVCFAGLFLLAFSGYYYSTATFARADTVEKFETGIDRIMVRLDISDAEGKLREVGASIRQKQDQLDDLVTILDGMGPSSPQAAILRDNIRDLTLDIQDLRRQEANYNSTLENARSRLARASTP